MSKAVSAEGWVSNLWGLTTPDRTGSVVRYFDKLKVFCVGKRRRFRGCYDGKCGRNTNPKIAL